MRGCVIHTSTGPTVASSPGAATTTSCPARASARDISRTRTCSPAIGPAPIGWSSVSRMRATHASVAGTASKRAISVHRFGWRAVHHRCQAGTSARVIGVDESRRSSGTQTSTGAHSAIR